jgi:hypothetical protein
VRKNVKRGKKVKTVSKRDNFFSNSTKINKKQEKHSFQNEKHPVSGVNRTGLLRKLGVFTQQ